MDAREVILNSIVRCLLSIHDSVLSDDRDGPLSNFYDVFVTPARIGMAHEIGIIDLVVGRRIYIYHSTGFMVIIADDNNTAMVYIITPGIFVVVIMAIISD